MADVQFQEDAYEPGTTRTTTASQTSGIRGWLVTSKIAKDLAQADYILAGILMLCILIAGLLTFPTIHQQPSNKVITPTNYVFPPIPKK